MGKPDERDPVAAMIEDQFRESRRNGMSITATCDMLAAVLREAVLDKIGEKESEGAVKADYVMMQSVVGAATGAPSVQFRAGFEQWQLDPDEARTHALKILECAEAAVHDAATMRWLTLAELGLDKNMAMRMIADLRRFRGDVDRRDWRVPDE